MEQWKEIEGFDGLYLVSNLGRVLRKRREYINPQGTTCVIEEKELKPSLNGRGYLHVKIRYNGKRHTLVVHRLVAKAFLPNPANKPQVNHIDGNKLNNRLDNLEFATAKENIQHAWDNNLRPHKYKIG